MVTTTAPSHLRDHLEKQQRRQQQQDEVGVPSLHLVITNIQKRNNVRKLLLTAAAFGCDSVLVVGQASFDFSTSVVSSSSSSSSSDNNNTSTTGGASSAVSATTTNSDIPIELLAAARTVTKEEEINDECDDIQNKRRRMMKIQRFETWDLCLAHLKRHDIQLVGVEIHPSAIAMDQLLEDCSTSQKNTAFLMGNEGQGILPKYMSSCDIFVRIPQYGVGTASLNVYVAASIVLHRFHQWQRTQRKYKQNDRTGQL